MTADTRHGLDFRPPPSRKPPAPRHRRHAKLSGAKLAVGGLVLALLVIAVVLFVHHREAAHKPVPPPPRTTLTTVTATQGDIGIYLDSIGTITPVYTAAITSQVVGTIVAVHYAEGQRVKKGDPLLDIDARPYEATLLQAQGALSRDQNLLAQASMDLERYREAWSKNAIAKQQLDDQEKVVLQDEGTVKNDQGTVQYAQVQVDFCHIRAPIDGRVGLRLVDPGNLVQATGTTTLAVVTQLEPITAIFTVAEDSLAKVTTKLAAGAKLTVDAYDRTGQKKIATGTLITVDNQIDTTTGTVKARALFANADDALFPNQFVNTRLLLTTLHDATLVPHSAIQQNGDSSFVYVIDGGQAHNRPVKPGATENGITQVDGLSPGDVLANSSFDKLHDGALVTVAAAPPGQAAPPPASQAP